MRQIADRRAAAGGPTQASESAAFVAAHGRPLLRYAFLLKLRASRADRDEAAARTGRPRRRPVIALAATVLAVLLAGGLWLGLAPGDGGTSGGAAGSCAAVLSRDHHFYEPYDTVRVPPHGRMLGRAYWCQDTGPASEPGSEVVYAVPGIPEDQGFLVRGRIWLRTDLGHTPAAVRRFQQPVSCRRAGTFTGQIEQVNGHPAGNPVAIRVPYTLGIRIDRGLGSIGMQGYDNVRVTVRITSATQHAGAFIRLAARVGSHPENVRVRVACDGDAFVAQAIRRR